MRGTGGDGCVWSGADIIEIACDSAFVAQSFVSIEYEFVVGVLLGDVNCDGEVNLLDVDPFIAVLAGGDFNAKADINQDGVVNLLDIDPFIALISG